MYAASVDLGCAGILTDRVSSLAMQAGTPMSSVTGDGGGRREKFARFSLSEQVKWARVVKDGNAQVDS